MKLVTLSVAFAMVLGACANETDAPAPEVGASEAPKGGAAKAEAWSHQDRPSIFTTDLDYKIDSLPRQGEAANIPWAASYWPVYQDSINYRWAGPESESPAAKYGRAFGIDNIEDKVSQHHGIDAQSSRTECTQDSDCDSDLSEKCAKRHGAESGRCIPTWWGICHAWAPASILEPEAVEPVTVNGVEFRPNDIKALMTLTYNRASSRFVSLRCNENDAAGEIEYDIYNRPTGDDTECKDTNPGTYHVLLANYLGIKGQSFVEDRTFDYEVWNQPLRSYEVKHFEEVSELRANELVGVPAQGSNDVSFEATVEKDAWHHQEAYDVTEGAEVKVVMTGNKDADLYVRVGAQPTDADYDCRPYAGGSDETCTVTIPAGQSRLFISVFGYSGPAEITVRADLAGDAAVPAEYVFNNNAAKLYYVKTDVEYIAESPSSMDGNLADVIDTYTHTDHYEYILEVDADGDIVGGEWVGASKRAHPDFLWLPTGRYTTPIAGGAIDYNKVKDLLDQSIAGSQGGGGDTPGEALTVNESGTVAKDAWVHFGPFEASAGAFEVVMTGTSDADLYVKKGAQPTDSSYDCRPYKNGSSETCSAEGPGAFYVSVKGWAATSDFALVITYTGEATDGGGDNGGGDNGGDGPTLTHLSESGHVADGEMKFFSLTIPADTAIVVRTTASNDVDLYTRMNLAPTEYNYDARGYTASGNETIHVPAGAGGVLHIGVHGYEASDFQLTTATE